MRNVYIHKTREEMRECYYRSYVLCVDLKSKRVKSVWFIVMIQARFVHITLCYPMTGPVHCCTIFTPWGPLHHCHCRCWLNNHDANCVHMPGTHFPTGWRDDPCLSVLKAWFELDTLWLLILCSTS